MPRTSSQALEYWQFDVGLFNDLKIVDLNEKYGPLGESIFFRVLSLIAESDGYFAMFNDALILNIYRSIGSKWIKNRRIIAEVIHYCGVCGLFDVNLLSQNVITSRGIQRRWIHAKKKSRARGFSTDMFWLLSNEPEQGIPHSFEDNCSNNTDNCSNNADCCNNNDPYKVKVSKIPPLSPNGGGEEEKERFFSAYPKLKGIERLAPFVVDYASLYQHFQKSEFLRSRFSSKWVIENYADIIAGVHDDKASAEEQARARAEWYRQRRERAEEIADVNRAKAEERCGDIIREIKRLEIAISKAEARGEEDSMMGEAKALLNERDRLEKALAVIGLTESDLRPRYRCRKCSDTGYLPNGKPCDCYEKLKGEKGND